MSIIPTVQDSYKVPGFLGETQFGVGAASIGDQRLKLLVVALKDTAAVGTATLDTEVFACPDAAEADTKAGAGSELNRMLLAALRIPNVDLYGLAVTPNGAAVAGTFTATVAGTWTTAGVIRLWIGGELHESAVGAADNVTTVAAAMKAAILANTRGVCSADNIAGVLTGTHRSAGVRALNTIVFKDLSGAPSGLTLTLAGGTAVTGDSTTGNGVRLVDGAGVETMTTALATIANSRFHRIAFAQQDATSIAAWEVQLDAMAGPTVNKTQHAVCALGSNLLSTATSVAQTTANNARMQCLWMKDSESHPSEIAAVFAAYRTLIEQDNPNAGYDGVALPGIRGQRYRPSRPTLAQQISALDGSVTPIDTLDNGDAVIVRSITTRSQNSAGTVANYNTLDTAQAVVPDYVRDVLQLVWTTDFVIANPYVRDDPAAEEATPKAGVATPSLWNAEVTSQLLTLQDDNILTQVESHPPVTTFNANGGGTGWLESIVPAIPLPLQHAIKVSVRQQQYGS